MTRSQAVQEMLYHAEELVRRGETRQVVMLLDKILRLDFTSLAAWQLLYKLSGVGQSFEAFQQAYAQEHYPSRVHMLNPPVSPAASPVAGPVTAPRLAGAAPEDETVLCLTCGKANRSGARFCAHCGAPFQPAKQPPTPPGISQPQAPVQAAPPPPAPPPTPARQPLPEGASSSDGSAGIICPHCGRANPRDARLCAYCGFEFYPLPEATPSRKDEKEKPAESHHRFRLHFVDLGVFLIVISMLLPWAVIDRSTFIGSSSQIYDGWGIIAEFGGGANINIAVILFFLLGGAAYILVRARNKVLAIIAAVASLAAQIYIVTTMMSISGQSVGDASMFFDLSSLEFREGGIVGLVGAIITLIGVIRYERSGISDFLKRSWKVILILFATLFVCVAGLAMVNIIRGQVESNSQSTRAARTFVPLTQTSFPMTETALAPTPRASGELKNYRIVYVGARDSGNAALAVWVANGDGSDQRQVYDLEYDLLGAFFSADQRKIIFYGSERKLNAGKSAIWVVNSDGKKPRLLAEGYFWQLSPDRKLFVYSVDSSLWLSDLDGKNPRRMATGTFAGWLPDSQSFVFVNQEDNYQFYRINIDGSGLTRLTTNSSGNHVVSSLLTPDGKIALFSTRCGENDCLFRQDFGSGEVKQLTQPENGNVYPVEASPDSKYVACYDKSGLIVVDIDSTNVIGIISSEHVYSPNWSPDGKWLLFSSNYQLFVVQPGSEPLWIRLTNSALAGSFAP